MHDPLPSPGADASLTRAQRETLAAALNVLVPASPDGRMPAAADIPELVRHMGELAAKTAALRDDLDRLDRAATKQRARAFASLDEDGRRSVLDEMRRNDPAALHRLALETVTCYYQQDRVVEALGMEARPPYPKGYLIEQGDFSLLNPVIARGKICRDAP